MDSGKVIEGGRERTALAQAHDQTPPESAVLPSFRTYEGARLSTQASNVPSLQRSPPPPADNVWIGAISRLQTQVSLNTSMLESHRRQVADIEQAVGRLQQEIGNVIAVIQDIRGELQARAVVLDQARQDHGDVEVLAAQVTAVTTKANEIDSLRMQLELLRNRVKRFEDHESSGARPMSSHHREMYDPTHPSSMQSQAPLPPMRPHSMLASPPERLQSMPGHSILPSQGPPSQPPRPDQRPSFHEPYGHPGPAPSGYRIAEALPPPSALSSWRPAESKPTQTGLPQQQPPPIPFRGGPAEQDALQTGWAAVNVDQPPKRPFESPYDKPASTPGSPKRPRLAPIMPRGNYTEDVYGSVPASMPTAHPESQYEVRSRAPSNASQPPSHALPTPASASTNSYRFVPSTAESQAWRADPDQPQAQPPSGRGRGRGRGRGGRGRGSRGGAHSRTQSQELEITERERERTEWSRSQASPEAQHVLVHQPEGLTRLQEGYAFPATPVHGDDPFAGQGEFTLHSSGKKSRTKPIRNAEGVLIRKDGRPDMRSVSSANNLRKVHAKREAERAEADGRTPTSGRSLAPAHSNSMSEDDPERSGTPDSGAADADDEDVGEDQRDEQDPRVYPYGISGPGMGGEYYQQHAQSPPQDARMKQEGHDEEQAEPFVRFGAGAEAAQADTIMRNTGEEHAAAAAAVEQTSVPHDVKMAPIQEQPEGEREAEAVDEHVAQ